MKLQGEWTNLLLLVALFYLVNGQIFPRCETKCGNVTFEYPFGSSPKCYYAQDSNFRLFCNETEGLFIGDFKVISISQSGELHTFVPISYSCDNGSKMAYEYGMYGLSLSKKNKFSLVGCNAYASLSTYGFRNYSTGCISVCNSRLESKQNSHGEGQCTIEVSMPIESKMFKAKVDRMSDMTPVEYFNPCAYAFLVENGSFVFNYTTDLWNLRNVREFPVVFDWSIGNKTCNQVRNKSICGENSKCVDSIRKKGYICQCLQGYNGNPYLPNGCQDTNECISGGHNCSEVSICENTIGSFNCNCRPGYRKESPQSNSCTPKDRVENFGWILTFIGITIVVLAILFGVTCIQNRMKRQRDKERRQQLFDQNGGDMLIQRLSGEGPSNVSVKIFTEESMMEATNGYDKSRILGEGGQGTVYKGILQDNSIVAIKKARLGDRSQVEQFINEVLLLSQINHRNVVKLLGCCLETAIPLLVYEFINSGSLFDHLHGSLYDDSLTWEHRLRIAIEVAGTLAYLHSSASIPIIHRDVKSGNILVDENLRAKLADFGASRLIPMDKDQLTTMVQGTLGYLDPEYYNTGFLTDKSDVYSFGVVLMELLTGQQAYCFDRPQASKLLVSYFTSAARESRLVEIIDGQVVNEDNQREVYEAAKIGIECTRVKGEERPKMTEVAARLEALRVNTS